MIAGLIIDAQNKEVSGGAGSLLQLDSAGNAFVVLGDNLGAKSLVVKASDSSTVFSVDSTGGTACSVLSAGSTTVQNGLILVDQIDSDTISSRTASTDLTLTATGSNIIVDG